MRSLPVTVIFFGFRPGFGQPLLHSSHEVAPCNCDIFLASGLALDSRCYIASMRSLPVTVLLAEPLEGVDSFDVLSNTNDFVFYDPGLSLISAPFFGLLFY